MHLLIEENFTCLIMSKIAEMKCDTLLFEDDIKAEERSRLSCVDLPQSSLPDGQSADLLRCQETNGDISPIRRHGSRLGGVKVRHKRQVLQDMARPLKHWLYKHRDNPYPTKTEKVLLALGSHMTLVQVSNWFANARRRLKNTVRQPDLSWALRIKLYNKYIQGNAERLSVCSDNSESDDEHCPLQTPIGQSDFGMSHKSALEKQGGVLAMADSANSDDSASPPSKYKSSLLNRYLNDTLRHMMAGEANGVAPARKRRSHSESFSSNDCDRDVVSPASSYETEANFVYHMGERSQCLSLFKNILQDTMDYTSTKCDREQQQGRGQHSRGDQDWREIHAAVALTNLAQGQSSLTGPKAGTEQSSTRGPTLVTSILDRIRVTGPNAALRQSCTTGPTLTSRIIQKSSHISEVQTVNVALANSM
ncbi:homeobox protein Mohawk-like isoform X1 [Gymnodraco acuticeps]|uniref:Homeobox protein Mohawk-like isoform X1 n=1 Tax=Gymnodraco acuticeps TaxID=8218 RepID=A0A6P8V1Z3_GYMAC|nr:homeobox protein Mohawk-like isoform X1 [Gymnodraco acuticeps]